MSARCKVCNASRITYEKKARPNEKWECQTCGNLLDADGKINSS